MIIFPGMQLDFENYICIYKIKRFTFKIYLPFSVAGLAVGLAVGLAAEIYNLYVFRNCHVHIYIQVNNKHFMND